MRRVSGVAHGYSTSSIHAAAVIRPKPVIVVHYVAGCGVVHHAEEALITVYGKPGRPKKAAVNGAATNDATAQTEGAASGGAPAAKAAESKTGKGKGRKAAQKKAKL